MQRRVEKLLSLSLPRHNGLGTNVMMESYKLSSLADWLACSRSVTSMIRPGFYGDILIFSPLPVNIIVL